MITIVDCPCGSGKTSWAIQFIDNDFKDRFIYITPFLDEIERVKNNTGAIFKDPDKKKGKGSKTNHFLELLKNGEDICSTHALFRNIEEGMKETIKEKEYILILDEVMDVVEQLEISKDDINLLLNNDVISVDEEFKVSWINDTYKGKFNKYKYMIKNGDVYLYNNAMILWTFPCDIFKAFKHVYILTYMFDGQVQRYYYDLNKLEYEYKSVVCKEGEYELVDYFEPDVSKYKDLINIYEGKLNNIGNETYAFSVSWLGRNKDTQVMKRIKDNSINYFKNIIKSKSEYNMWTTFEDYKNVLKGERYTKGFVECNARATNEYKHKTTLAYLCNRYYCPVIKNFFIDKGVSIDEDCWALSELIQWMFRSQVRENKPIDIYIPSKRMRRLLQNWLK